MSGFAIFQDDNGPFVIQTDITDNDHAVLQNKQGESFPLPDNELDSNKQIVLTSQTVYTTAPQNWDQYNPGTPFISTPLMSVKPPSWDDAVNGVYQAQERKSMQPKAYTVHVSSDGFRKLISKIGTGSSIIDHVLVHNILSTLDATTMSKIGLRWSTN
jgi:hypothetical protein